MRKCGFQIARQLYIARSTRGFSAKSAAGESEALPKSSNINQLKILSQFLEGNGQIITAVSVVVGGAYYLGCQHVFLTAELNNLKREIISEAKVSAEKEQALLKISAEKDKVSTEKEQALAKVSAEKEQALAKILAEKEKVLEKVLAEKEKTQAAEKRELEARIRELEMAVNWHRTTPPAT